MAQFTQSTTLTQRGHFVHATGEHFVRIGLVTHIPHQAVMGGVEDIVERHCEFHRAQVGTQMTTGFGHTVNQERAQFIRQCRQLVWRQSPHIGGRLDAVEQWGHEPFSCKP